MTTGTTHETSGTLVSACDVTDCTYNQQHRCTAGQIQVSFVEGMAHCATYTPTEGAMGMGSTGASDQAAVPRSATTTP